MSTSKTEQLARDLMHHFHPELEQTFGYRPDWLRNPETGHCLEIDIWFADLQAGIEVQGIGHHRYTPGLHTSSDDFDKQLRHDTLKLQLCAEWGVRLYHLDAFRMTRSEFPKFLRMFEQDNQLLPDRRGGEPTALYATADKLCSIKVKTARPQYSKTSLWQAFLRWLMS